jgi:hypothetical protein
MKTKYPILCLRVALSRLTVRFCKIGAEVLSTASALEKHDALYTDIMAFKESCPFEWRPDQDTFAEPEEYQHILLMHMEYHALLLAVFTSLSVLPYMLPEKVRYGRREMRNQMVHCITNSRRMLQILNQIAGATHAKPDLICWYVDLLSLAGCTC